MLNYNYISHKLNSMQTLHTLSALFQTCTHFICNCTHFICNLQLNLLRTGMLCKLAHKPHTKICCHPVIGLPLGTEINCCAQIVRTFSSCVLYKESMLHIAYVAHFEILLRTAMLCRLDYYQLLCVHFIFKTF